MNRIEADILRYLAETPYVVQRKLADDTGHSIRSVARGLLSLRRMEYLDRGMKLTEKAWQELEDSAPRNAIILASRPGMRMIPINMETPKALLEVRGEALIERLIRQLHEVGITEIHVIVGFMAEQLEYLIDTYDVNFIFNEEYATKNNLYSMNLARRHIRNTYIVPCDVYCQDNPFRRHEMYSWYMVSDGIDPESPMRVNRRLEIVPATKDKPGNAPIGISYINVWRADIVRERIHILARNAENHDISWEEALYSYVPHRLVHRTGGVFADGVTERRLFSQARVVSADRAIQINTYEQLREFDSDSKHLHTDAIDIILETLQVAPKEIHQITAYKKGMTNRSFLFTCRDEKYIMRIPGEGTDRLVDRRKEAAVYEAIRDRGLCDEILYINPDNGYKITKFLIGARNCDPLNMEEVAACMKLLRAFHEMEIEVAHSFDLYDRMDFYESLWNGAPSAYRDYIQTKRRILSLRPYIEACAGKKSLTHIDAVSDNFLFTEQGLRLIDWEYAGMQDPHVDIAMFSIYAMYDRAGTDRLIDLYFPEGCARQTRIKIYCYIATCGLLWSNWCEFKRNLGIEFGEYALRQYRYAKEYYRAVRKECTTAGEAEEIDGALVFRELPRKAV